MISMAYSGALLKINNIHIVGLKEYEVNRSKLWKEAGRNMNGDISATMIGVFPKLELTFRDALTEEEISTIETLLDVPYFDVTYYDPKYRGSRTAKYYANDYTVGLLERKRGLFKSFTVHLIPVSKEG